MAPTDTIARTQDAITVRRVFADPHQLDGLTIIAAAVVTGGGGGGSGIDPAGQRGEGGGFGITARPVGAYVIKDGQVTWQPALDLNRLLTMLGILAIVSLARRPRTRV